MSNKPAVSIKHYLRSGEVQKHIRERFKEDSDNFTTSVQTAINSNDVLQQCKPESILSAAITAWSMHLPINPNLGFAYIIPYQNKKKQIGEGGEVTYIKVWEAQFQMGWKGFIQLANRSNQYKLINATDVREGEYVRKNRMTGEIEFDWIEDEHEREKRPVIGYLGYFRLHSGFEKMLYMSVKELETHAKKFSKAYQNGYGQWVDDKPGMSRKTVIKLLISRWGPMATDRIMQKAILADQAAIDEDSYKYVDNEKEGKDDDGDDAKDDTAQGSDVN